MKSKNEEYKDTTLEAIYMLLHLTGWCNVSTTEFELQEINNNNNNINNSNNNPLKPEPTGSQSMSTECWPQF